MADESVYISVVIPVFNEQDSIKKLWQGLEEILVSLRGKYEIIFVDDSSNDKTPVILKHIQSISQNVRVIRMKKNAGQSLAILTGFIYVRGRIIVTIDGDLQNDPTDIPKLLDRIEEGYDLVSGWRYRREDGILRRIISRISNALIAAKTGVRLRDFGCALTAVRRELIERLLGYGENAIFIKPLLVKLAKSVGEVKVSHRARITGKSHYSIILIMKKGISFLINFERMLCVSVQRFSTKDLIESIS